MSMKNQGIVALFVLLIIILAVNPKIVNNIYETILGRVFLIGITIFFAMHNTTLGLLVALTIISAINQFGSFTEGMESNTPITIGDDNVSSPPDDGSIKVVTKDAVIKAATKKKAELTEEGVDKEAIKTAIMSKESNTIPTDPNMTSSDEVTASSQGMLDSSAKLEGFSSYATAY
jgi:hypothetical protein